MKPLNSFGAEAAISLWKDRMCREIVEVHAREVVAVAKELHIIRGTGATLYTTGNGGSGSIASHFAGDLVKNASLPNKPFRALCLNDNFAAYSAFTNDASHETALVHIFDRMRSRQSDSDSLFIISSSGESKNVVALAEHAILSRMPVISLVGKKRTPLARHSTYSLYLGGPEYHYNEPMFSAICHLLIHLLRQEQES